LPFHFLRQFQPRYAGTVAEGLLPVVERLYLGSVILLTGQKVDTLRAEGYKSASQIKAAAAVKAVPREVVTHGEKVVILRKGVV
jgi:hypothetical protein